MSPKLSSPSPFRPDAHNGVWCALLLPAAMWASFETEDRQMDHAASEVKLLGLFTAIAMSAASLVAAYEILYSPYRGNPGVVNHLMLSVISDLFERRSSKEARMRITGEKDRPPQFSEKSGLHLWNAILGTGLFLWLSLVGPHVSAFPVSAMAVACLVAYSVCLRRVFHAFPGSFTFGEGCVVLQAAFIFLLESAVALAFRVDNPATVEGSFAIIAKAGMLGVCGVCALPLVPGFRWLRGSAWLLPLLGFVAVGLVVPYLWFVLKRNPVLWLLGFLWTSRETATFIVVGVVSLLLALKVVADQESQASTKKRKVFHALSVAVYVSGVALCPEFLFLASVVTMAVFVLLESVRFHRIEPFASALDSQLKTFLDEKDAGALVLTHIYLHAGCSLALWLSHGLGHTTAVSMLGGVLCVGVGDAAASIVGSRLGRIRFPDSVKTLEGVAGSVAAQLAFLWALRAGGFVPAEETNNWVALAMPVVTVSLMEALTDQVDNLVLPLIMYIIL